MRECLLCDKDITIEHPRKDMICNECKDVWKLIKEQKLNEIEKNKQRDDPVSVGIKQSTDEWVRKQTEALENGPGQEI